MEDIYIELDKDQVARINAMLLGMPKKTKSVFYNALRRSADSADAQARRELRKRYTISQGELFKQSSFNRRMQVDDSGVSALLNYSGQKVSLSEFKVSPASRTYRRQPVSRSGYGWLKTSKSLSVKEFKVGSAHRHSAFMATMASGHNGVWQRNKPTRFGPGGGFLFKSGKHVRGGPTIDKKPRGDELEERFGESIADMLDYHEAREKIQEKATETAQKRLDHEIFRILNGY